MFEIESSAFTDGRPIPKRHTGEGENLSPPLSWRDAPPGTKELALVCDDPDAAGEAPFVHWVLYRIPHGHRSIPEGSSGMGVAGRNDFGRSGWGGPMPPPGSGPHHYRFRLYALDAPLELAPGATKQELQAAIDGHVLAEAGIVGTYERKTRAARS